MQSIFVSSTFRDMNFERDVLNREIGPALNYALSKFNRSVRISDLRWGIDTSDMAEKDATARVLSVCFDEIENCKPYIVILLGDRYGYIPDQYDKSVTHMEILKGVIEKTDRSKVFIYMRNADYSDMPDELRREFIEQNPSAAEKLTSLKRELREILPDRCKEYDSHWSAEKERLVSESYEKMVLSDLRDSFEKEYAHLVYRSSMEKYLLESEYALKENTEFAYRNEEKLAEDVKYILEAKKPVVFADGSGAGKTVYLSLLCNELRDKGKNAHIIYCGDNAFSSRVRNIAETVLYLMSVSCGEDYDFEAKSSMKYEDIMNTIISKRDSVKEKLYVLLDAADRCESEVYQLIKLFDIYAAGKVGIIFSSRRTEELAETKRALLVRPLTYSKDDMRSMMCQLLSRQKKELPESITELAVNNAETPIELRLMLHYLLSLDNDDFRKIYSAGGQIDSINAYIESTVSELKGAESIVRKLCQRLFENEETKSMFEALISWIAFSEYGLFEDDLQQLAEFADLKWVQLDYNEFLVKFSVFIHFAENGRLDISHDIIRTALRKIFSDEAEDIYGYIAWNCLMKKNLSTFDVRNFFYAVNKIDEPALLKKFILDYHHLFSEISPAADKLVYQIAESFSSLIVNDDGEYYKKVLKICKSGDELAFVQSVMVSSFKRYKKAYSEETLLKIAHLGMYMSVNSDAFGKLLGRDSLMSCEQLLKDYSVQRKKVEQFVSHYRKLLGLTEYTLDKIVADMISPDTSMVDYNDCFQTLIKIIRPMVESSSQADEAIKALHIIEEKGVCNAIEEIRDIVESHINAFLSQAYKTKNDWENAVKYAARNVERLKKAVTDNPTDVNVHQYRKYLYNLANTLEARALLEDRPEYWEETCTCFKEIYEESIIASLNSKDSDEYIKRTGIMHSYAFALFKTGKASEGMSVLREFVKLSEENNAHGERPEVILLFTETALDGMCRMLSIDELEAADLYIETAESFLNDMFRYYEAYKQDVLNIVNGALLFIHEKLGDYRKNQLSVPLEFYDACIRLYRAILPITDNKLGIISMYTAKGNDCFDAKKNYEEAANTYEELLSEAYDNRWLSKEQNGEQNENLAARLCSAYTSLLVSLNRIGDKERLDATFDKAISYVSYFSEQLEAFKTDPAALMHKIAMQVAVENKQIAMALLFNAAQAFMIPGELENDLSDKYEN
ncbi:MAG: DUF4062 domain-containing protein [Clostridia bacterium]|nr:DUF4062 domain-containing protein [Clostridia bacterium]